VKGMTEESGSKKVERFICERENLVFDSLIYLEPVERFKFRSFGDSRVKDKLKTIRLCSR